MFLEQSIAKSVSKPILNKSKKLLFDDDKLTPISSPARRIKTPGVGPELETRGSGTVYPMSGLGNVSYSEEREIKHTRLKSKIIKSSK